MFNLGLHKKTPFSTMIAGHTKCKLKWRNLNVETLTEVHIYAVDVINPYLFYQSYPFKNIKICIWLKEKNLLCISSGSKINHRSSNKWHNIPQIVEDQDKPVVFTCMTGKHISRISLDLCKIGQDIITSNFMLTTLGDWREGEKWRQPCFYECA